MCKTPITSRMKDREKRTFYSGSEIIMTGYAGLAGTVLMANAAQEQLGGRFSRSFLEKTKQYGGGVSLPEMEKICGGEALLLHAISEGGVLGALWNFCEEAQCGMEVQIRDIPIRQETVEICEFFDVNPYYLRADGAYLIAAGNAGRLAAKLREHEIDSRVIGRLTDSNDRVLLNDGRQRFLDRPAREEYERWCETWRS